MTTEEWRPVVGFPDYRISSFGRVLSGRRSRGREWRPMRPGTDNDGYLKVLLRTVDNRSRTMPIHRMVAEAFHGPRPPGQQIRHLDGNPQNNVLSNLRYGSATENTRDSIRHGTHPMTRRAACKHGHPYDEANTYVHASGRRICRTCHRLKARHTRARLRAAA